MCPGVTAVPCQGGDNGRSALPLWHGHKELGLMDYQPGLGEGFIKPLLVLGMQSSACEKSEKESKRPQKRAVKTKTGEKLLGFGEAAAMKGLLCVTVLVLLSLAHSSRAVYVQDGDMKFSLESVKKLKELMDRSRDINPRMKSVWLPCEEKDLPEEFQSVCERKDAPAVFERLNKAVQEIDLCEICANAACAGCL